MFFFNSFKPKLESLKFSQFGWKLNAEDDDKKQWLSPDGGTSLSVNFFKSKPDLPAYKDVKQLRAFYKSSLPHENAGVVEVETYNLKGLAAVRTIFKFLQEPSGIAYLGSITLPFHKYSYVLKVQAMELGATGLREAIISEELMATGEVKLSEGMSGWIDDPYGMGWTSGVTKNKSEHEKYDIRFIDHPLSRVRHLLAELEQSVLFDAKMEGLKPFEK